MGEERERERGRDWREKKAKRKGRREERVLSVERSKRDERRDKTGSDKYIERESWQKRDSWPPPLPALSACSIYLVRETAGETLYRQSLNIKSYDMTLVSE